MFFIQVFSSKKLWDFRGISPRHERPTKLKNKITPLFIILYLRSNIIFNDMEFYL